MSRLTLDSVKWGEFYFSEVFDNIYIAQSTDLNKLDAGETVFIGRSSYNNGLQDFVNIEPKKIINKNCITVSMVGEPRAFYQQYDFTCSQNILILRNDKYLNKSIAIYLCSIMNSYLMDKGYGYGYPVGLKRILRNKIILPIDSNGNPNWQFMEDYIKQEMQAQSQRIVSYYENKLMKLGFELLDLEVVWKEFEIKDVFETFAGTNGLQVPTGSYIKKSNLKPSEIPRITVKETNNGIDNYGFSKDKNFRVFENFISVSFLGGVFYHPYKASIDMKVHALIPKSVKLDEYNANFLINSIKNNIKHSSYGNQLSSTDLPRVKIMLPTDKNGEPHWKYMSNFVKKLEKENIEKTLEHIYIYI